MSETLKQRIKQSADFLNPVAEAMVNLLASADYVRTRMERVCSDFGVTHGQFNVLRILRGAGSDGHPRCEIATRMVERAPDVTRLVDRLEKQGLVVRDRSSEDKRHSVTRITEKGLDLLARMDPKIVEEISHWSEKISLAESIALSSICEKIYSEKD